MRARMLWRGGRDAEQWELAKQMSWGLSASSLVWEPSEYGSNAMSFMEKKRLQVTEMLNLEAHVQGKKQHDLFKSMPEGNAKEEMRRILKLHKVLGEEGATHAVQERQQFHVYRHCSTDGGKTLPFTLEFALVSEFNGAILGCPVSFKAKKWPTWKVCHRTSVPTREGCRLEASKRCREGLTGPSKAHAAVRVARGCVRHPRLARALLQALVTPPP